MSRYQFPAQATTDATLLVSGTLSDARLSSNVALENVANVFTQLLSFSGTDTPGLQLKSLTSAQITALATASALPNGSILRDSDTDRIDARLARGTVELLDTAGGQTINGNLNLSGTGNLIATGVGEFGNGTGLRYMLVNGANSGTTTGAAVRVQNAGVDIGLFGNASAVLGGAYSSNFAVFATSGNNLHLHAGGATDPTIRILSSGLVGIGTGSGNPTNALSVGDGTGTRYAAINGANSGTTGGAALRIQNAGTDVGTFGNRSAITGGAYDGTLWINANGTAIVFGTGSTERARVTSSGQVIASFFRDSTSQVNLFGTGMSARSNWLLAWSNDGTEFGTKDLSFSRSAAGVGQIGNGTANASGSLNLTNLTASGTVRLGTFTVGTLPSASANTRARAFVTDSNLAFNSTNLGATVTAGGSTLVPVFSNGTNWVIG